MADGRQLEPGGEAPHVGGRRAPRPPRATPRDARGASAPEHALAVELAQRHEPQRGAHEQRAWSSRDTRRPPSLRAPRRARPRPCRRPPRDGRARGRAGVLVGQVAESAGRPVSSAATRSVWRPICRLASRSSRHRLHRLERARRARHAAADVARPRRRAAPPPPRSRPPGPAEPSRCASEKALEPSASPSRCPSWQ